MRDLEDAKELFGAAERDVSVLRSMDIAAVLTVFPDEAYGFFVQQATEKLFKTWLIVLGEFYPMTHDLGWLHGKLSDGGANVARYKGLVIFEPFAIRLRYIASSPETSKFDRADAFEQVEALLEVVRHQLAEAAENR